MTDAVLTKKQGLALLQELRTNPGFRRRFAEKPAAALLEIGVPHETIVNLNARCLASRNAEVEQLIQHANGVTRLLAARKDDLVTLMQQGNQVFEELQARKESIHRLLVDARQLAVSLKGIADDNKAEIGPALADLHEVTVNLRKQRDNIQATVRNLEPYASILINVIGTGPWFDAYVPNLVGLADGEFVPGRR